MKRTFVSITSFALALWAGIGVAGADGLSHKATPCVGAEVSSPADYKVFVDKPTGYTYVCTPAGWKFVNAGDRAVREQTAAARADQTSVAARR
ncbi:MAG: hypothetical protein JNK68_04265 [Betaproteobacteria bacterium]|nr:hypothetical protein [Betaproteobacteria bacterium]